MDHDQISNNTYGIKILNGIQYDKVYDPIIGASNADLTGIYKNYLRLNIWSCSSKNCRKNSKKTSEIQTN